MKYRMENLDEFVAKAMALGAREIFATQKLQSQKMEIPGPKPQDFPETAVPPNIKVDYITGYILFTARGKEMGTDNPSNEFIFYAEDIQPAVVKNEAEAKILIENVNKRKAEVMAAMREQFGSSPLGEIIP